ncbi:MAG: hypothetical protein R3244_01320 [Thermoanaerobaculia bacterium]|nr:hypothetical protein [Thermoanaerobaculia bacterium]
MNRNVVALLIAVGVVLPPALAAQERVLSIAASGGLVGSLDEDEGGFSNSTFQARFAVETARRRLVAVRLGRMDFGDEPVGRASEVTLDYLSLSGEYLFEEDYYESGLFAGLGLFDLASTRSDGRSGDETAVGLVVGALGEFRLADRWFIYGEAAFAYTNLDVAQLFADLQIGVGFRF